MSTSQKKSYYSVLFVCLGNICRSPLAEGIFRDQAGKRGLLGKLTIDSCGTGSWHIGKPPHVDSQRVARENQLDISSLRARQLCSKDFSDFHLLVAMDSENKAVIEQKLRGENAKVCLLREFDPSPDSLDVPDPYFEGNFEGVYRIIERSCAKLLDKIEKELA